MKMVDSDSKGKIIFKNKRGTYIGLTFEELYLARDEIEKAIAHRELDLHRYVVDKRKY